MRIKARKPAAAIRALSAAALAGDASFVTAMILSPSDPDACNIVSIETFCNLKYRLEFSVGAQDDRGRWPWPPGGMAGATATRKPMAHARRRRPAVRLPWTRRVRKKR
jgi:hypothetical protein